MFRSNILITTWLESKLHRFYKLHFTALASQDSSSLLKHIFGNQKLKDGSVNTSETSIIKYNSGSLQYLTI